MPSQFGMINGMIIAIAEQHIGKFSDEQLEKTLDYVLREIHYWRDGVRDWENIPIDV